MRIAGLLCTDTSGLVSSVWSAKLLFRVRACGIKLLCPHHFNRLGSNHHTLQASTSKLLDIGCLPILKEWDLNTPELPAMSISKNSLLA